MSQYEDLNQSMQDSLGELLEHFNSMFSSSFYEQIRPLIRSFTELNLSISGSLPQFFDSYSNISRSLVDAFDLSSLSDSFASIISSFNELDFSAIIEDAAENDGVVELCDDDFDTLSTIAQAVSPAITQKDVSLSVKKKMPISDFCSIIQTILTLISFIWMISQDHGTTAFQQKQLAIQQEALAVQQQQVIVDEVRNDELAELNEYFIEYLNHLENLSSPEDIDSCDPELPNDHSLSPSQPLEQNSTDSETQDLSENSDS